MSAKSSKRDDVEALLSDLDNLGHTDQSGSRNSNDVDTAHPASKADDAQSLLDDLDDLVKRRGPAPKKSSLLSSSSSTPSRLTKSTKQDAAPASATPSEGISNSTGAVGHADLLQELNVRLQEPALSTQSQSTVEAPTQQPSWGNWWNSATKLADQARAELEKRAAQVQSQVADTTREASEGGSTSGAGVPWAIAQNVNSFLKNNRDLNKLKSDFSKVSMKGWNELLNVVVPPIEKHEVLSITLSHGE
jgi:hypothetical protein